MSKGVIGLALNRLACLLGSRAEQRQCFGGGARVPALLRLSPEDFAQQIVGVDILRRQFDGCAQGLLGRSEIDFGKLFAQKDIRAVIRPFRQQLLKQGDRLPEEPLSLQLPDIAKACRLPHRETQAVLHPGIGPGNVRRGRGRALLELPRRVFVA